MSIEDQLDAGCAQGFQEIKILFARHGKYVANTFVFEGLNKQLGSVSFFNRCLCCHSISPTRCMMLFGSWRLGLRRVDRQPVPAPTAVDTGNNFLNFLFIHLYRLLAFQRVVVVMKDVDTGSELLKR